MIEHYLGATAFRDGVRRYMERHREGNAPEVRCTSEGGSQRHDEQRGERAGGGGDHRVAQRSTVGAQEEEQTPGDERRGKHELEVFGQPKLAEHPVSDRDPVKREVQC